MWENRDFFTKTKELLYHVWWLQIAQIYATGMGKIDFNQLLIDKAILIDFTNDLVYRKLQTDIFFHGLSSFLKGRYIQLKNKIFFNS